MSHYSTDVCIIGAGPSGLFSVFECGFVGYKAVVVDALPKIGGQLAELYPEKPIYDIPGYPHILAGELVEKLKEQAAPYQPTYLLGAPVSQLEGASGNFTLTAGDNTVQCKVIIIAGGGGMFTPRKPDIPDITPYENISIFYAVRDKAKFAGKRLVIAGGGDSALDWAVQLAPIAQHVHLVHRRADFKAAESTVAEMRALEAAGKITLEVPYQITNVQPHAATPQHISAVVVSDLEGNKKEIPADFLLCFYGLVPTIGGMAQWGLTLENKKIQAEPTTMQTNIPGILVVGDMAEYPGKLGLILTGFAESALAAKQVQALIHPDKKFKLQYSTSKGVPG